MVENLSLGSAADFQTRHRFAVYVHPSRELPDGITVCPRVDVTEQSAIGAFRDPHVKSERTKRIETMLCLGYCELEIQPSFRSPEVAPQQLRCRITEQWLRDCFTFNDKMTVADCVEAARIFIDEGAETLKELYGRDAVG